jgi:adenine-specific DNA-methyltransferase
LVDDLDEDFETLDETADEWVEDEEADALTSSDIKALEHEVSELRSFAKLATGIEQNAKGRALLTALGTAFARAKEYGAAEKAIIFTESKRTQAYLLRLLADSPYAEGIVLFNGSNTDPSSRSIYAEWAQRNKGTDRVTGSKTADMRSALVDEFRDRGRIMIATEAGAEGINLQFCSLVVNYDLPWNPQRIEQRIGRCHRYGQKHDVVVVNFLNEKNEADQRVYQLLDEKFRLFDGVFGSSDEVLGAIESGVDFEKRIADIYQDCRRPEDIRAAFDILQKELSSEISSAMASTRQKLLENFDDEVREKLKTTSDSAAVYLKKFETDLINLARFELRECAVFENGSSFNLHRTEHWMSAADIPLGKYELPRRSQEAHLFRLNHPLGQAIISRAKARDLPVATLYFKLTDHQGKISTLEPLVNKSGWMSARLLSISALDQSEDHIILSGFDNSGTPLSDEALSRMLTVGAEVTGELVAEEAITARLTSEFDQKAAVIRNQVSERNARYFEEEAAKLDGWADDLKVGLEREIKEIDRKIKEARRAATLAVSLEEKLAGQKAVKALELERNTKRRSLFDAQDKIDEQRAELISVIEGKLGQNIEVTELFKINWNIV